MSEQRKPEKLSSRLVRTINAEWKFRYYPQKAEQEKLYRPELDDSDWKPIAVPHTWQTYETTEKLHPFIHDASERDDPFWWYGRGWYRKRFNVDPQLKGKRISVEFDGVQKHAWIWLNGEYVGEHRGGFTSFYFDLTDYIQFGRENLLAVEVSNRRNDPEAIPPMTAGNWDVYGGIYRDVRLVVKNSLHIPFQGSADHEGGTFVMTPEVSEEKGRVQVKTHVKNDADKIQKCTLQTTIFDPQGECVAQLEDSRQVPAGELIEFLQETEVICPELWSPANPALYSIESRVFAGEQEVDQYSSPLGFRWFHWDYDEHRLYLNGEKVHIHGTNRHQEYPWLGDAIPKWMHKKDLRDIRFNLGHNFLRACHYPQDKMVYELCDRYGIIACEEVPNIKNIAFNDEVQKQNVIEMIRRDRNHPSILFWSMGNETYDAADQRWALAEDDTRIIHCRKARGRGSEVRHNHEQMEMEILLRCTVRGWYNEDVKDLEPEYGQHTGHEKWQHDLAFEQDASIRGRIDTNGVVWIYNDHGADREYKNCPLKHVNPKGWVDSYRVPKQIYYLWQANWSDQPVLHIHPYDWTRRYLGKKRDITINSNCEYVELKVNGESQGRRIPSKENDFTVVYENIRVCEGKLEACGRHGKEMVTTVLDMAGEPERIELSVSHETITADRAGISLVQVDIVDENGVHVYGANNELQFELTGPGRLLGPKRLESDRDRCEEMAGTMYIDTPIYMPVRSGATPGTIKVEVSSAGLKEGVVEIESLPPKVQETFGIEEPEVEVEEGRISAVYDVEKKERPQATSRVLDDIQEDIDLTAFDEDEYKEEMDAYIRKNHHGVHLDSPAYRELLDLFVRYLKEDRGVLVADDYNFIIRRFNDCHRIYELIYESDLSDERKAELEKEYARKIISEGHEITAEDVMERL